MFTKKQPKAAIQQEAPLLALDIGTEYIKTVLFRINAKREVEVIGYDRARQKPNAMRGALIINLENVIDVVDVSIGNTIQMAEKIVEESVPLPKSVILGIAGELVKGVVIEVDVERDRSEEKINEKEVQEVISMIKRQAFDSAREQIALDTGIKTSQIAEIDTVVNSVYIDGVKVDSPIGFKGKDLVYKVFSTFAPKIHLDSIKEVAQALNLEVMSIVVEPYALAMALENSSDEKFSGVFIDIGGGTTDVAVVNSGAIVGTKMFAFGGRVFTRRIEKEFNLDYLAAEAQKIDYADQKLGDSLTRDVKKAVAKDIPIWLDGVEIALSEYSAEVNEYPSTFYLCGGGTLLPDINSGLLAHPWLQVLPFKKFPKFNHLFPNQVREVIDLTRKITQPMDVTPVALARMALDYVNREE